MQKRFIVVCVGWFFLLGSCRYFESDRKDDGSDSILHDPAYTSISDSIRQFPNDPLLYLKRGLFLSNKNLHDLANADYSKAWKLQPDESTALAYVSNLFLSARADEAIVLLQQCMRRFPQNSEFARRLSEAYQQTGKSREALALYDTMIHADPGNFEAYYEKGVLLVQLADTAGAVAALEKAYAIQPLQLTGISLANLYAETRSPKTLALCDALIAKDAAKELTDAVYIKGIYLSNTGRTALALEQFEACIQRDWKFTEAYIEKGIILYQQRNIDEALNTFALAARVSNTYADAYYWMGRCFETSGKKEEARTNYSRALALDKNFIQAREALKRMKEGRKE